MLFGNATGTIPTALPRFARLLGGNLGLIGFSITALRQTRPSRVADALVAGLAMLAAGQVRPSFTVVDSLDRVGEVHDLLANRAGTGKYVVHL